MISFGPTEEQEIVRDTLKEFADQAMRPIARDCDEESSIPQDFLDTIWELGLTATQIPEACGGGGEPRSPVTNAILLEELGYGDASLAVAAMTPSGFANAIDGVERMGHVYEARGDHKKAAEHYREAAAFIRSGGYPEDEHAAWLDDLANRLDPQ